MPMGPDDENDDDFGVVVSDDAIPIPGGRRGRGRQRRQWEEKGVGGGAVASDTTSAMTIDRPPPFFASSRSLPSTTMCLSLLRRESSPGQAREWRSEMRRRHKRWRRRLMGGVGVTRGERRRDNQPDKRHESGRWRRKQQQLQLRNNQQKERGTKTRLSSQR